MMMLKKWNLALISGAIAVAGGLAFAQTTVEGMEHSNMDHSGLAGKEGMDMMNHASMIPPELAYTRRCRPIQQRWMS